MGALTGCFRELERLGRGGGSISVFRGERGLLVGGCTGCTGDRVPGGLRGDGGTNDGGEALDTGAVLLSSGLFKMPG